jgi:hypothetical protein
MNGATDLFCYNRNSGIGAFFATVRSGHLNDGTVVSDGPRQVGPNHTFHNRWTHIVYGPFQAAVQLLFYDASSGVGEFYSTDGHGNLTLKKRHTGWRTSWTQILAGRFGNANLLFYDPAAGLGAFYRVDALGAIHLVREATGWRESWHSIVKGNFSNSPNDDLLFYDKSAGAAEFYRLDATAGMTQFHQDLGWRKTWQKIVPGQFLQKSTFDGLLFYEEGTGFTKFYATDGHANISKIDVNLGNPWALPWKEILAGEFTPNLGIIGTSRLCCYDAKDGTLRYFYFEPATIKTLIDLNGKWASGGVPGPTISSAFTSLTIDMSAFHRPSAHGSIEDASTITVTFPDDATFTAKLQLPNMIKWANHSTWTKV